MRDYSEEFVPAQMGLTGDPMILHNMNQGSKDPQKKGSTNAVIACLLFLGAIVALVSLCVLNG